MLINGLMSIRESNIMKKISVNSLEPFNVIQNVYDFNPNFYHINEIGLIKTYQLEHMFLIS